MWFLSTLGEEKRSSHSVQQEKRKECIIHYLVLALVFSGSFSLKKWEKFGRLEEAGRVRTGNKQPLAAQACGSSGSEALQPKTLTHACEPYIWLKYFSESSNSCLQVLFIRWLVGLILFYEFISILARNQERTYQGLSAKLHVNQKYLTIIFRPWWIGWICQMTYFWML